MRVAVVGSGIAGNSAAWALASGSPHEIVVYESGPRAGGHSATIDIDYDGTPMAVDTGFIVYNELNYPNLTALFAHLDVATQKSDMGFSVSADGGRRTEQLCIAFDAVATPKVAWRLARLAAPQRRKAPAEDEGSEAD